MSLQKINTDKITNDLASHFASKLSMGENKGFPSKPKVIIEDEDLELKVQDTTHSLGKNKLKSIKNKGSMKNVTI